MAQDRFKNFSVYGDNGRKVEFQTDATLSGKSNAEQVVVDGKVAGSTEGVDTSTASIDMAICIGGALKTYNFHSILNL